MSDQDPQAPVEDTPDQQVDEPSVNWEKRYTDLQPEYTRASQEAAEYRRLVEGAKAGDLEALQALGLEFVDQEDTADVEDLDPYDSRIAAIEQRFAEQEKRREEQAQQDELARIDNHIQSSLKAIEGLDEDDHEWVALRALNLPALENGMPDVAAAHQMLQERDLARQKAWATTKKAPRVSPVGQAGTQQPDLTDAAQRQAFMAQRLAERNT